MTASYWTPKARPFAEAIRQKVLKSGKQWFEDQKIVLEVHKQLGYLFNVGTLDKNFVCYDFTRESPIWTCKGPARKDHSVYLERRAAC
jgi:hypothetical protein